MGRKDYKNFEEINENRNFLEGRKKKIIYQKKKNEYQKDEKKS